MPDKSSGKLVHVLVVGSAREAGLKQSRLERRQRTINFLGNELFILMVFFVLLTMAAKGKSTGTDSKPEDSRLGLAIVIELDRFAQSVACIMFQETLPVLEAKLCQVASAKVGDGWMDSFIKAYPDTQVARCMAEKRTVTGGRRGQQPRMRQQLQGSDLVWTLADLRSLLEWLASPALKAAAGMKPSSARRKTKKQAPPSKFDSSDSSVDPG